MHSCFHSLHIFSKMVYQRFFFPFLHNSIWLKPFIILSDTCLHGPWNGVLIHWGNESSSHIPPQGTCFKGDQSGQSTFISLLITTSLINNNRKTNSWESLNTSMFTLTFSLNHFLCIKPITNFFHSTIKYISKQLIFFYKICLTLHFETIKLTYTKGLTWVWSNSWTFRCWCLRNAFPQPVYVH